MLSLPHHAAVSPALAVTLVAGVVIILGCDERRPTSAPPGDTETGDVEPAPCLDVVEGSFIHSDPVTLPGEGYRLAEWSPLRPEIVAVTDDERVVVIPLEGGDPWEVTPDAEPEARIHDVAWTSDAEHLLVMRYLSAPANDNHRLDRCGEAPTSFEWSTARRVSAHPTDPAAWTGLSIRWEPPASASLGVYRDGRWQTLERWVADGELVHPQDVTFSPDGDSLAYSLDGSVHVRPVDVDGSAYRLAPDDLDAGRLAWSPDGTVIAVETPDGVTAIHLPDQTVAWTIPGGRAPFWSPDGAMIGSIVDGRIVLTPTPVIEDPPDDDPPDDPPCAPAVHLIWPRTDVAGAPVTLSGTCLGPPDGDAHLELAGARVDPTSWADDEVTFALPVDPGARALELVTADERIDLGHLRTIDPADPVLDDVIGARRIRVSASDGERGAGISAGSEEEPVTWDGRRFHIHLETLQNDTITIDGELDASGYHVAWIEATELQDRSWDIGGFRTTYRIRAHDVPLDPSGGTHVFFATGSPIEALVEVSMSSVGHDDSYSWSGDDWTDDETPPRIRIELSLY